MEEEEYEQEFEERVAEDEAIYQRINYLRGLLTRTPDQEKELSDLHYRYYMENSDVRRYWKTL